MARRLFRAGSRASDRWRSRGRWCALGVCAILSCTDGPLERAQRLNKVGRHLEAGEAYLVAAQAHPALLAAWEGAVDAFCDKEVRIGRCLEVLDLELSMLGPVPQHRNILSAALERRARIRLERGMVRAALADLERAQRAGPERATVFAARARALLARGDREGFERAIRRALQLDPGLEEAKALAGELAQATEDAHDPPFGGPGEALRAPGPRPDPSATEPAVRAPPNRAEPPRPR